MCLINCFVSVVQFAADFAPGHDIAVVFDDRPQKKTDIQKIYDIYRGTADGVPIPGPEITSVSFGSSKKILPLQAADLIAWEIYQDSLDSLAGRREEEGPRRPQLMRLCKGGRVRIEFCSPENVVKLAKHKTDPQLLKTIANHLDFK